MVKDQDGRSRDLLGRAEYPEEIVIIALFLALLITIVAAIYASVGLAGATGYLALLALFGVEPMAMKGASLVLNGVVASIGTLVFREQSARQYGLLGTIAGAAIPMAFVGGAIRLPGSVYLPIVGILLIFSALRMMRPSEAEGQPKAPQRVSRIAGVALGGTVGLLSGLTGTGGGIFLLPALQLLGWVGPREASGLAAPFVLVTSLAALGGYLWQSPELPMGLALWIPAAIIGGVIGAKAGRDRLDPATLRRILAALLIISGVRLLVS